MPILPPGTRINLPGGDPAGRYARKLLEDLGASVSAPTSDSDTHPARRWAQSGLMVLSGPDHDTPCICPVPLPSCADGALDAFRALAAVDVLPGITGATLLVERAAMTGYERIGPGSLRGQCRLLRTLDGVVGLNLARDDDWDLVPAWLGEHSVSEWPVVIDRVSRKTSQALLAQGRLLGLAVVDATQLPTGPCAWLHAIRYSDPVTTRATAPRVLDLSSLWAGPLCSHLWQAAGAEVIKVEGTRRPDGARSGSQEFFELLNTGKNTIALDLHNATGQRQLRELIGQVDIVLEGSRPRALRQMGIVAEDLLRQQPGLSWVSITGYGRQEPQANWIAYGDDAGVAAGLSALLHRVSGEWRVCGDAIADPLTGLHAALAGWAGWRAGGGHLLEVALTQTVRHCIAATAPRDHDYPARQARWLQQLQDQQIEPLPPQRRSGRPASPP